MTIVYKADSTFTGGAANTLPLLIHDLPVAGAARRFIAGAIQQEPGTAVTAWKDSAGSGTSLVPGNAAYAASQPPTLGTHDGRRAVMFDGVDDGLYQDLQLAQPHAVVFVGKLINLAGETANPLIVGGRKGAAGADEANIILGGSTTNRVFTMQGGANLGNIRADENWHVIVANFNGANSVLRVDDTEQTGSAGTLSREVLSLGFHKAGPYAEMAALELVVYSGALNSESRAATVTALREHYGI